MAIRSEIGRLGKNAIIFGIGNLSTKIAALLLIPIYTKYLDVAIVGTIALVELIEMFLLGFGSFGIFHAIWKMLSPSDSMYNRKIISSGFFGLLFCNAILLFIVSFASDTISSFIGINTLEDTYLIYLILLNIFLHYGGMFQLALWQYEDKAGYFITLSILQFLGTVFFSIYFIIFLSMGLLGVILAKTITLSIIMFFSLYNIINKYWILPSINIFSELVKFGGPLIFLGLVTPIITVSDRFFLNMFVPINLIGIYSINYKFGMLINMFIVVPLQRGLLPMIYKEGIKNEMKLIYKDVLFYYFIIGCFFIMLVTFFIEPIIYTVASPEYLEAAYIVPFIALSYLIAGFRQFFTPLVALKERTDLLGKVAIIGIIVCIILNFVLTMNFGINGAIAATILSYTIFTSLVYFLSLRLEPMNWGWDRIGKVFFLTLLIVVSVNLAKNYWNDFGINLGLIGILIFPILLLLFHIIGIRELSGMRSMISIMKNKILED
tara:strand:- start:24828 stop:26303 length:1476 start_codon:yes stop_codon:yes gene_type:complete